MKYELHIATNQPAAGMLDKSFAQVLDAIPQIVAYQVRYNMGKGKRLFFDALIDLSDAMVLADLVKLINSKQNIFHIVAARNTLGVGNFMEVTASAEKLFEQEQFINGIFQRQFPSIPETITVDYIRSQKNVAGDFFDIGKLNECIEKFIYVIYLRYTFDNNTRSSSVAYFLNLLAGVYYNAEKYKEAEFCLREANSIAKADPTCSLDTIILYEILLARSLHAQGEYLEAKKIYEAILKQYQNRTTNTEYSDDFFQKIEAARDNLADINNDEQTAYQSTKNTQVTTKGIWSEVYAFFPAKINDSATQVQPSISDAYALAPLLSTVSGSRPLSRPAEMITAPHVGQSTAQFQMKTALVSRPFGLLIAVNQDFSVSQLRELVRSSVFSNNAQLLTFVPMLQSETYYNVTINLPEGEISAFVTALHKKQQKFEIIAFCKAGSPWVQTSDESMFEEVPVPHFEVSEINSKEEGEKALELIDYFQSVGKYEDALNKTRLLHMYVQTLPKENEFRIKCDGIDLNYSLQLFERHLKDEHSTYKSNPYGYKHFSGARGDGASSTAECWIPMTATTKQARVIRAFPLKKPDPAKFKGAKDQALDAIRNERYEKFHRIIRAHDYQERQLIFIHLKQNGYSDKDVLQFMGPYPLVHFDSHAQMQNETSVIRQVLAHPHELLVERPGPGVKIKHLAPPPNADSVTSHPMPPAFVPSTSNSGPQSPNSTPRPL